MVYRYKVHAKEAETQAIRGGFFTSLFVGISFLAGLGMFGIAFWYEYNIIIVKIFTKYCTWYICIIVIIEQELLRMWLAGRV